MCDTVRGVKVPPNEELSNVVHHCITTTTPSLLFRNIQWTEDETFCARIVTNEVLFFSAKDFTKGSRRVESRYGRVTIQ